MRIKKATFNEESLLSKENFVLLSDLSLSATNLE